MEFDLENPLTTSHESIPSLFHIESDHMASRKFDISVRSEALSLISRFSCHFDPFLPYLAVNYLDRFLSNQGIPLAKPWVVKLLAISCVSLALKMRETKCSVSDIQEQNNGGFIFDTRTIQRMEVLILGTLQWRMRSITPFSFIDFFISLFTFKDPPLIQALKARASEIIFKAQNDVNLLEFRPSIIAASASLSASHELFPLQFPCFRKSISSCSYVNEDELFRCCKVIQETAMDGYESVLEAVSSSNTPVHVLDLDCPSSSSDSEKKPNDTATVRVEREIIKRRKIGGFKNDSSFQRSQVQQC
ncbi:putative cyclin-D6-1 [Actinidia eriantha]|uniref:putative cyclin-D6-1 n=1 Tax=Actinidia eriantha TaxID=165200 RepID=UPI002590EAB9|nr:putative cyclin-D6-1 [Actinidia eriantha]